MNTAAIATHLKITESAILEIQEWASVLWVRFVGGVRFVSKKIGAITMNPEKEFKEYESSLPVDACEWTDEQREHWMFLSAQASKARKKLKSLHKKSKEFNPYENYSVEQLMNLH